MGNFAVNIGGHSLITIDLVASNNVEGTWNTPTGSGVAWNTTAQPPWLEQPLDLSSSGLTV